VGVGGGGGGAVAAEEEEEEEEEEVVAVEEEDDEEEEEDGKGEVPCPVDAIAVLSASMGAGFTEPEVAPQQSLAEALASIEPPDAQSAGDASFESFGYSKGVVGETEEAARVNALMWKAESNAMASARDFLGTDAGAAILDKEVQRLEKARKLVAVGMSKPKEKLVRMKLRLRQLFALHELGEEEDAEVLHGPNNEYLEVDAGEIKYLLKRAGVRGLWGGMMHFPQLAEKDGAHKVAQVTFADVWEWLQEEQAEFKGEAKEKEAEEGELVVQSSKFSPLGRNLQTTSIRADAEESVVARARCFGRRKVLEEEGMLSFNEAWGGRGARMCTRGLKEWKARVVEYDCGRGVAEFMRSDMKGKAGRRMMKEVYERHEAARTKMKLEGEGRGGWIESEFAFLGGGVIAPEVGAEAGEEEEEEGGGKEVDGAIVLQRAEVRTFIRHINASPSPKKGRQKQNLFEELIQTEESGQVVDGVGPDVVKFEEFEAAWNEAWKVKWSFHWKFAVTHHRMYRNLCRRIGWRGYKGKEKKMLALYECRKAVRIGIAERALERMRKAEEARELGLIVDAVDRQGGTNWANLEFALRKEVY